MANYSFVCVLIALDILGGLIHVSTQNPVELLRRVRQSDDEINLEDKYGDPFARPQRPQRPIWTGNPWDIPIFGNQQINRPSGNLQINEGNQGNSRPTTPPSASPPTSQSTPATTPDPTCISSCLVTPQYNPVCGTNNVTYQNEGRLMCASNCGIDVTILRYGNCDQAAVRT